MSINVEEYKRLFDTAVNDSDNHDEDGQVIWNYVDADLWKLVKPADEDRSEYWDLFDAWADEVEEREAEILMEAYRNA